MKRLLSIVLSAIIVALCIPFPTNVLAADCGEGGHSYTKKVTKPTCEDSGYTTYTCSVCGDSYVSDQVPPLKDTNKYGWYWTDGEAYGYTGDTGIREENIIVEYDACGKEAESGHVSWSIMNEDGARVVIDAKNNLVYLEKDGEQIDPAVYVWGSLTWDNWNHVKYTYRDGNVTVNINGTDVATYEVGSCFRDESFKGAFLFFSDEGILTIDNWKVSDLDGNVLLLEDFGGDVPIFSNGLGGKIIVNDNIGHRFKVTLKEPTCTQYGTLKRSCLDCNYGKVDILEELGHSYTAVVTPPTCLKEGYTTHTCVRCGRSYTTDFVPALALDYGWYWDGSESYGYISDTGIREENIVVEYDASFFEDWNGASWSIWNENYNRVVIDAKNNVVYLGNDETNKVPFEWGFLVYDNWHHIKYIYENGNVTVNIDGTDIVTYEVGSCYPNEENKGAFLFFSDEGYLTIDNWKVSDLEGNVLLFEDFEGTSSVFENGLGTKKAHNEEYANHTYVYTTIESTCTEQGALIGTCSVCGYVNARYYNPLGHTQGGWRVLEAAGPDKEGILVNECLTCGEEIAREVIPADNEDFGLNADNESSLVSGVPSGFTAEDFVSKFEKLGKAVTVVDSEGNTPRYVGTGCIVTFEGKEYTVCVKGDLTGDGVTSAKDLFKVKKHTVGISELDGIYFDAADINGDGKLNAKDSLALRRAMVNG